MKTRSLFSSKQGTPPPHRKYNTEGKETKLIRKFLKKMQKKAAPGEQRERRRRRANKVEKEGAKRVFF